MSNSGDALWFYLVTDDEFAGPVSSEMIATLFASGELDGMSRVSKASAGEKAPELSSTLWTSIAEVPEVRTVAVAATAGNSDEEFDSFIEELGVEVADSADALNGAKSHDVKAIASAPNGYQPPDASEMVAPESAPVVPAHFVASTMEERVAGESTVAPREPDAGAALKREAKRMGRKRRRVLLQARDRAARSVYVTGIPADASEKEVAEYFAKCGIVMPDSRSGRPAVALYTTPEGNRKGDGKVTYAMQASVENAILLLDGTPLRAGSEPMSVAQVTFDEDKARKAGASRGAHEDPSTEGEHGDEVSMKETADIKLAGSAKRPRKEMPREVGGEGKLKGMGRKVVREVLGWEDDGQASANSVRMVVLKNIFDGATAEVDYEDVRENMQAGCEDCGPVEKVTVFEGSPEGAVVVKFKDGNGARQCIQVMHGRWYAGRKVVAEYFDGVTDYRVRESEEQREARMDQWEKWLEDDE